MIIISMQCAALANGCTTSLSWRAQRGRSRLAARDLDRHDLEMLRINGWRQDHGRWVCGLHEPIVEGSVER